MATFVGIDPGLGGGLAFYDAVFERLEVYPMPVLVAAKSGKKMVDALSLARIFDQYPNIRHIFMEKVSAMPGQGVTSMFNFGISNGILLGVIACAKVPYTMVVPGVWKRVMGVPANKDAAMLRATQLMPKHAHLWPLKKHDGLAEAALIALYGYQNHNKESSPDVDILS